jgi:hypothetical protein
MVPPWQGPSKRNHPWMGRSGAPTDCGAAAPNSSAAPAGTTSNGTRSSPSSLLASRPCVVHHESLSDQRGRPNGTGDREAFEGGEGAGPSAQCGATRRSDVLTRNRYRVPMQPASVGFERKLASQPSGCSLLTFVRPNDAHSSKASQSAPVAHALRHGRCRLVVWSVGSGPANAIGTSKGAGGRIACAFTLAGCIGTRQRLGRRAACPARLRHGRLPPRAPPPSKALPAFGAGPSWTRESQPPETALVRVSDRTLVLHLAPFGTSPSGAGIGSPQCLEILAHPRCSAYSLASYSTHNSAGFLPSRE